MVSGSNRRQFLSCLSITAVAYPLVRPDASITQEAAVHPRFPAQDDESVLAVVRFSHFDLDRVAELVTARPELAKAAWDWGYGDWETALGAASHTGNHAIAEFLIEHGAPPTLFSAAALGQLEAVRAAVEASPGVQGQPGPHGITLLEHARLGGERAAGVVDYLETVGGADRRTASEPYGSVAREAYFGRYRFGDGPDEYFEGYDQRGALMLRVGEGTGRGLTHLGGGRFHPAGAPSVRIVFGIENGVPTTVTIHDPDPLVTGVRAG